MSSCTCRDIVDLGHRADAVHKTKLSTNPLYLWKLEYILCKAIREQIITYLLRSYQLT